MPVTLKEIAAEAGVTPRVVSAVVNDDFSRIRVGAAKREMIASLLRKHNYAPNAAARMLQSKKSCVFNVVIPSAAFFQVPQYSAIVAGLQQYAESIGFRLEFTSLSEGYREYRNVSQLIGDGIVLFYWGGQHDEVLEELRKFKLPVVAALGRCTVPGVGNLYMDNEAAMHALAVQLIDAGHSRLAYMPQYRADRYHLDGWDGLQRAAREHGADVKEYRMSGGLSNVFKPDELHAAGREQMQRVLADPFGATVVFCTEDEAAMGAIDAARGAGKNVPDDIAVCGNGNTPHGAFWNPGITTVDMRPLEYGEALGRMLSGYINGDTDEDARQAFEIRPVFRGSTGISKK